MLFSVIVLVYKVEKCLNKCVNSILEQSFRDFELILVDDGSPDKCGEICDVYSANDSRVVVIHQKNQGISGARNAGLDRSRGEYVIIMDGDDWVEPGLLEGIYQKLAEGPKDLVVWGFNRIYPDKVERNLLDGTVTLAQAKANFLSEEWIGCTWNKCWRRGLFQGVRYPKEVVLAEDLWVTGLLIVRVQSIAFIDKCLYNYRKLSSEAATANISSLGLYWCAITLLHHNRVLRQEGLPNLNISNMRILWKTSAALLANKHDKLLTAEQVDELNTIFAQFKGTLAHMDPYSKYKSCHSLLRYAKGVGDYGQALAYAWGYVFSKARYFLGKRQAG